MVLASCISGLYALIKSAYCMPEFAQKVSLMLKSHTESHKSSIYSILCCLK